MDTPIDQVLRLETQLKEGGVRIDDVLREAAIDRSTWTRWKQGKSPNLASWLKVTAAAEKYLTEATAFGAAG